MSIMVNHIHPLIRILTRGLLFFFLLIIMSCSTNMNDQDDSKFDPALREKIRTMSPERSSETIPVFIKSEKDITPELKIEIESTGVNIESVAGTIITANGTAEHLKETARLPYIIKLELSHNRKFK